MAEHQRSLLYESPMTLMRLIERMTENGMDDSMSIMDFGKSHLNVAHLADKEKGDHFVHSIYF